jgi:hypothetical protein
LGVLEQIDSTGPHSGRHSGLCVPAPTALLTSSSPSWGVLLGKVIRTARCSRRGSRPRIIVISTGYLPAHHAPHYRYSRRAAGCRAAASCDAPSQHKLLPDGVSRPLQSRRSYDGGQALRAACEHGQVLAFLIASPWNSLSLTIIIGVLIGWSWTAIFICWIAGDYAGYRPYRRSTGGLGEGVAEPVVHGLAG